MFVLFFLFLLSSKAVATAVAIGVQSHSYDDLREIDSLIAKGVRHMKVDPHIIKNQTICSMQNQLDGRNVSLGCLLLTHNPPMAPFRTTFNTSFDLVAKAGQLKKRGFNVTFALCFKYDYGKDICGDENALFLMDELVSALRLVADVVIDGAGTPNKDRAKCMADRWLPLPSTWIPLEDPLSAFQSNVGADIRFQIFNCEVPTGAPDLFFSLSADAHFGKFATNSYNIQVWEPSSGKAICEVVSQFTDVRKFLRKGKMLRFASNLDPFQLIVLASPAEQSTNAWQTPLPDVNGSPFVLSGASTFNETHDLVISRYPYLYALVENQSSSTSFRSLEGANNFFGRDLLTLSVASSHEFVVILSPSGKFLLFTPSFELLNHGSLLNSNSTTSAVKINGSTGVALLSHTGQLHCLLFSVSGGTLKIDNSFVVKMGDISFDRIDFDVQWNTGLGIVCISNSDYATFCGVLIISTTVKLHPFTYAMAGSSPSVQIVGGVVHLAISDSGIYNNDPKNKIATGPSLCDRQPSSDAGVVNYVIGNLSTVVNAIENNLNFHACNNSLLVGSVIVSEPYSPVFCASRSPMAFSVYHQGLQKRNLKMVSPNNGIGLVFENATVVRSGFKVGNLF